MLGALEDSDVVVDVVDGLAVEEVEVEDSGLDGKMTTDGAIPVGAMEDSGAAVGGAEDVGGAENSDEVEVGKITVDGANTVGAEVLSVVVVSCPTTVVWCTTIVVIVSSSELEPELVLAVGWITVERLSLVVPADPASSATTSFCPVIESRKSERDRFGSTALEFKTSCAIESFTGSDVMTESL